MEKLHFEIEIKAPKNVVWKTMLEDATYREWTSVFNEKGSWFEGRWEKGSVIRFLGPGEDGVIGGMLSRIVEYRPDEFVSIEHIGMIMNGIEDTTSDEVKKWTPAFENYSVSEVSGITRLSVDLDITKEFVSMFEDTWPKGLQKLKDMCER